MCVYMYACIWSAVLFTCLTCEYIMLITNKNSNAHINVIRESTYVCVYVCIYMSSVTICKTDTCMYTYEYLTIAVHKN